MTYDHLAFSLEISPEFLNAGRRDTVGYEFFAKTNNTDPANAVQAWRPLLYQQPYSSEQLDQYARLSPQSRAHVWAYETALLHELTHVIDYRTTLYGAAFEARLFSEYHNLVPLLIELSSRHDEQLDAPWAYYSGDDARMRELAECSRWHHFDTLVNSKHIVEGWDNGEIVASHAYSQGLRKVRVLGEFPTVAPAEHPTWYLRPRTIMEAHAVANSMLHLARRFSERPSLAAQELREYFGTFYPYGSVPNDYRFLFDLIASAYGFDKFEHLLVSNRYSVPQNIWSLKTLLLSVQLLTWVALQGQNPAHRFVMALDKFEELVNSGKELVDQSVEGLALIVEPEYGAAVRDELRVSIEKIHTLRDCNNTRDNHPLIRDDFERRLSIIERQLRRRTGLADPRGNNQWGNVLYSWDAHDAQDLGRSAPLSDLFNRWLRLRSILMFRRTRSGAKSAAVREYLTLFECR